MLGAGVHSSDRNRSRFIQDDNTFASSILGATWNFRNGFPSVGYTDTYEMSPPDATPGPEPKVSRIIERYDLPGIETELESMWTRSENRYSLRKLADWLNQRMLEVALEEADVNTVTDDVSYIYSVMMGERGSSGQQTQLKRQLERDGVDVEELIDDFLTYQAIRSYLINHRNASLSTKDDDEVRRNEAQTIERVRERVRAVTESKMDRLVDSDRLHVGPYHVFADVRVLCEECGNQYAVRELFSAGSCDCYET